MNSSGKSLSALYVLDLQSLIFTNFPVCNTFSVSFQVPPSGTRKQFSLPLMFAMLDASEVSFSRHTDSFPPYFPNPQQDWTLGFCRVFLLLPCEHRSALDAQSKAGRVDFTSLSPASLFCIRTNWQILARFITLPNGYLDQSLSLPAANSTKLR